MTTSTWWQLRRVNPEGDNDGWLSWDHDRTRPYRFYTEAEAVHALATFTGRQIRGWSGRVVRIDRTHTETDI